MSNKTFIIEMDENDECNLVHEDMFVCTKANFVCHGNLSDRPELCPLREITSDGGLHE